MEQLRAKRESMEKRRYEGSVDSADDEDEELGLMVTATNTSSSSSSTSISGVGSGSGIGGNTTNRQHYRSRSVLPSSKLGIEMMRANSHDSMTVGSSDSASTLEPTTQVVTPNRDFHMELPNFVTTPEPVPASANQDDDEDVGDSTVVHIQTPPEREGEYMDVDVEETPKPNSLSDRLTQEDDNPTPRPPTRFLRGAEDELPAGEAIVPRR
jgi:serine/threonine-protein kinase RIM15